MIDEVLTFEEVKKEPYIIEHVLWDMEPRTLMEPRFVPVGSNRQPREEIKGYVFYIDTMDKEPALFLMRHTAADFAETVAEVREIPRDMLRAALEENKAKAYFGMYPINGAIRSWLERELGLAGRQVS
jgi:hypothetical protein